ncbi:hypothetical protein [Haloparvum sp. PAK95]|uniref:hypothetical protein n=1 Tax=Haloparvum sp. PAK95 TaxID=3418962 RepID=UPI003D2F44C4
MRRRAFIKTVTGTGFGLSIAETGAAECTPPAPDTPTMGENWSVNDESVCDSSDYNLYRRVLTNNGLQRRVRRETNGLLDQPMQSLIAIRLTPQTDFAASSEGVTECSGSYGATAFGFGLSLPCSVVEDIGGEDEVNPVSPEATRYLDTAFRDKINYLHGFTSRYDRQRHLRRSSYFGWKSLAYSKTGYDTFGFTYEPVLKNQDDDALLSDLNFRAYLSVETDGKDYLGVGGVFPDEESPSISTSEDFSGELEFDVEEKQDRTIEFMEGTRLSD